jgi:hypothetical protein
MLIAAVFILNDAWYGGFPVPTTVYNYYLVHPSETREAVGFQTQKVPPFALHVEALMYRYFSVVTVCHTTFSRLESLVSLVAVIINTYKNSKEEKYFKK